MKNRITAVVLAVLMILSTIGVLSISAASDYSKVTFNNEEEKLAEMKVVAESPDKSLKLYFDEKSGEIAILDTKADNLYLSNPYNVASHSVSNDYKYQILSQVALTFVNYQYNTTKTYYSYSDSTLCNQMEYTVKDNGLVVGYKLGEQKRIPLYPMSISESSFNELLELIEDEKDRTAVENAYMKPFVQDETAEQILSFKTSLSNFKKENVERIFNDIGYTYEMMYAEYDKIGYEYSTAKVPSFYVEVEYTIDNEGFTANAKIIEDKCDFDKDIYYIASMSVLPYFSAANRTDKGYNFVPDGSGALIRFENVLAQNSIDNTATQIYGNDYAQYTISIKNMENVTMPVFGLVNNSYKDGKGFFAIIEEGDAMATVVSSHSNLYNSIYGQFKITPTDVYDLADSFSSGVTESNEITVRSDRIYNGNCKVKYVLLTSKQSAENAGISDYYEASYIGMAKYYRDYLTKKGDISKFTDSSKNPKVFFEVFGSTIKQETILSFPVYVNKCLTSFSDIMTMYNEFSASGLDNMNFILTGFANGGLSNDYYTYLKWQKVCGGKNGYNDLMDFAEGKDLIISPNIDFSYSYGLKAFSGFSYKKYATRTLDNRYTTYREYEGSLQMFTRVSGGVSISTASFQKAFSKFYKDASKYTITSLAALNLGSDLNSDFDKKGDYYNREESKNNTIEFLSSLTNDYKYDLIINAGNSYAVKYASGIINASLDSSRIKNESESIPFLGMVYHGSVEFSGQALNTEGDEDYIILKILENGANLFYTLAMDNVEILKDDSSFNKYYSVQYETWKPKIEATYAKYSALMKNKQNMYIVDHEFLNTNNGYYVVRDEDGEALNNSRVVRVEYENHEGFILNYNSYSVTVKYDGIEYNLNPLSYATYSSD